MPSPYDMKEKSPQVAPCPGFHTEGPALGAEQGCGPGAGRWLPSQHEPGAAGRALLQCFQLPAQRALRADCKRGFRENAANRTFPETEPMGRGPEGRRGL